MTAAHWTVLGSIVVGLGGAIVTYIVALINRRPVQKTVDLATLVAAADEWREMKDDYRDRLSAAEKRIDRLASDLRTMSTRLHEVEYDRDALAEAAAELAEWEDAGRPHPPGPPELPVRIREILGRLHRPD